jgi:hypothetical protein
MSPAGLQPAGRVTALGEEVLTPTSVREGIAERQNLALVRAASAHELRPMERLVLAAYIDAADAQGARIGRPGVCWPKDSLVAAFLGTSVFTVRRARHELEQQGHIEVQHVEAGGTLPDGTVTTFGAVVVTVLGMVSGTSGGGGNPGRSPQRGSVMIRSHCPLMCALPLAA